MATPSQQSYDVRYPQWRTILIAAAGHCSQNSEKDPRLRAEAGAIIPPMGGNVMALRLVLARSQTVPLYQAQPRARCNYTRRTE